MKVSVLPWLDVANYGSVLQIFAVYNILKKYSENVEIMNYMSNSQLNSVFNRNPIKLFNNLLSFIFQKKNFRKISSHLNFTKENYCSEEDFKKYTATSDIYCTGSDQIWNMNYGSSVFGPRFLDFLPEGKRRFAFSSSFGDWISDEYIEKSKSWINQFECISVREDIGLNIINERYDYHKAIQLVDPTLALAPDFWRSCSKKTKIKGEYILVYDIINNKAFYEYAKELSKRTGLPLVHLCHRFALIRHHGKSILFPPIFDFITLIDNAKYVLTGSFHASAFAINLNTEPICSYHCRNPSRLSSLLRLVGAENLAMKDFNDFDVINRTVDFAYINDILCHERKRVYDFLDGIFMK